VPPRTGATLEARRQNADASAKAKNQTGRATKAKRGCQRKGKKPNWPRHEDKTRMPAQRPEQPNRPRRQGATANASAEAKNQTARAAKPLHRSHRNSPHPTSVADKKTNRLNNTSQRHRHI
jgi:hypothetical protein